MSEITVSEARARLAEAAEDWADISSARLARAEMAETGEAPIPWEQVKSDLGIE